MHSSAGRGPRYPPGMRIGVFADVHGNSFALRAVLDALASVDVLVNLGDSFSGALDPAGTWELLRDLDAVSVRGNHDRTMLGPAPEASDRHARARLPDDALQWASALPAVAQVTPDVLACHGTPSSDSTPLLETLDAAAAPPVLRAASPGELSERLADAGDGRVVLCGHTHLPGTATSASGTLVVNPGSVGWPAFSAGGPRGVRRAVGTPHARFATLASTASGWAAELHRVAYDWDAAAALADRAGHPFGKHLLRCGALPPGPLLGSGDASG